MISLVSQVKAVPLGFFTQTEIQIILKLMSIRYIEPVLRIQLVTIMMNV